MTSVEVGITPPVSAASYPHGRTAAARLKDSDGDGRSDLRKGAARLESKLSAYNCDSFVGRGDRFM